MSLLDTFRQDIVDAMKAKDKQRLDTLRGVKGAMQLEIINNKKEENDNLLVDVVNKQIKMRNDSIVEFEKGGREDLINQYKEEIEVLTKYMPKALTSEEIEKIIDDTINKVGATSVKDFGSVMKEATPLLRNKCDMKSVTAKIKDKLSNL